MESRPPKPFLGGAHRGKILIVEDDLDLQEILGELLSYEEYQVHSAYNGMEGLKHLLEEPRPDLILLDLKMPLMNGWELLKTIKADSYLSKIPVVVFSAISPLPRLEGAAVVVQKPFNLEDLLSLIDGLLHPGAPKPAQPGLKKLLS